MMLKTDYAAHDRQYKRLRADGYKGWGAERFDERISGWKEDIEELLTDPALKINGKKLLEVGSGAGDISMIFAEKGFEVSGIEISPTAVKWAKEKSLKSGLKADFQMGDVCNLKRFETGSFDLVVDGNCLHCIIGSNRLEFLNEIKRVVKSDGAVYISTMIGEPRNNEAKSCFDPKTRCQVHEGVAYRYFSTLEDILEEFNQAGFVVESYNVKENAWWEHLHAILRSN